MNAVVKNCILLLTRPIPDKLYLKMIFRALTGKKLNIDHPETFNEKLNWLKIHDRNPKYTQMVDKSMARDIAAKTIGGGYVPKLLGVYEKYEDIDFEQLPSKFVLKCTHDGGSVLVCSNRETFDFDKAKKVLTFHLKRNAFWYAREWPYKNVKPRIIAEEYLSDGKNKVLPVYKIFCFNGEPKIIQAIHNDKHPNETVDYFDAEWNWLDLHQNYPRSKEKCGRPNSFVKMMEMAKVLSKDIAHVRVDFYEVNEEPIFSEFTFYNDAGICRFYPDRWDFVLGEYIKLPNID